MSSNICASRVIPSTEIKSTRNAEAFWESLLTQLRSVDVGSRSFPESTKRMLASKEGMNVAILLEDTVVCALFFPPLLLRFVVRQAPPPEYLSLSFTMVITVSQEIETHLARVERLQRTVDRVPLILRRFPEVEKISWIPGMAFAGRGRPTWLKAGGMYMQSRETQESLSTPPGLCS